MDTPDCNEPLPIEPETTPPALEPTPTSPPEEPPPLMPAVWRAVWASVLYLGFFAVITWFNARGGAQLPLAGWIGLAVATTVGYLFILMYAIRAICRVPLDTRAEVKLLFLFLFLFLAANPMTWKIVQMLLTGQSFMSIISTMTKMELHPVAATLVPYLLIVTGVFGGRLLSRLIREWNMLLPVGLISALIDFWGVYWGPVSMATEQASEAVSGMATAATAAAAVPDEVVNQVPETLRFLVNLQPPQNIGLGDFVFTAFFLACALRAWNSDRRTAWGIFTGLLLASILMAVEGTTLFGIDIRFDYLPGLVFICAGVLLANATRWTLSRQEWAMTGVLVALLGGFIAYGAISAEMGKPKSYATDYTLGDVPVQVAMMQSYTRALGDMHLAQARKNQPAPVTKPVFAQCAYERVDEVLVPTGWAIAAFNYGATLTTLREIIITGQAQSKGAGWDVAQTINLPPARLPGYLRMNGTTLPTDDLALARQTPAMSKYQVNALGELDPLLQSVTKGEKSVMVMLDAGGIRIISAASGKVLKQITFPKPR